MQEAVEKLAAQGGQAHLAADAGRQQVARQRRQPEARRCRPRSRTLGFKRVITGPTNEAVELKLEDLVERGAKVVQAPELTDGVWTAVCEHV